MREFLNYKPECNIRVYRQDTGEVIYETHNVIVNAVKWLFARMMANVTPSDPEPPYKLGHEVQYPVWGLALGAGYSGDSMPPETSAQTNLITEFLRKPLDKVSFVDSNYDPILGLSTLVDFQTVINATTDNITQPIREMGLIGGGSMSAATDMMTADYFHPEDAMSTDAQNKVILINYKTLPPLTLPQSVNVVFSWVLSF